MLIALWSRILTHVSSHVREHFVNITPGDVFEYIKYRTRDERRNAHKRKERKTNKQTINSPNYQLIHSITLTNSEGFWGFFGGWGWVLAQTTTSQKPPKPLGIRECN